MRLLIVMALLVPVLTFAAESSDVAIYARAFNGYTRTRLADHTFKPETYVFAQGSHRAPIKDKSLEAMPFLEIVRTIAVPLQHRGYVPAADPKQADLAIFVYWGMTQGAEDGDFSAGMDRLDSDVDTAVALQATSNRERDLNNAKNAALLGYRDKLQRAAEIPWLATAHDAVTEIELDRYYVVLIAVDFKALAAKQGYQLRWEARFSIPAHGNGFDRRLADMANAAAQYFGENLNGLVHGKLAEPKVEVGTPKVVESGH